MDIPAENSLMRLIIGPRKELLRALGQTEVIPLVSWFQMLRSQSVVQACFIIRMNTEAEFALMSLAGRGQNTNAPTIPAARDSNRPPRCHAHARCNAYLSYPA